MKMDMCRALSTLYTSVISVLPDKYGDEWGISGMNLFRDTDGENCQMDVMFVGIMDDRETAFSGCYRVLFDISGDSLKREMLFVDGKEVSCLHPCVNGCLCTSCLCAAIRFFLDQVDDAGKLCYRVCNTLGDTTEYESVGYQYALKTGTVTVECNEDNVRYLTVPKNQLFFFNLNNVNGRIFESKFHEIKKEAIEKYGLGANMCSTAREVLDMCGRIEGTEEIFLKSALSVLVQR